MKLKYLDIINLKDETEKKVEELTMNRTFCLTQNSVIVKKEMRLNKLKEDIEIFCSIVFTKNVLYTSNMYKVMIQGILTEN